MLTDGCLLETIHVAHHRLGTGRKSGDNVREQEANGGHCLFGVEAFFCAIGRHVIDELVTDCERMSHECFAAHAASSSPKNAYCSVCASSFGCSPLVASSGAVALVTPSVMRLTPSKY